MTLHSTTNFFGFDVDKSTKSNKNRKMEPMRLYNSYQTFVRVEYPGIVKNVDNMLATLGGINTVSEVFSTPNRRLPLRFSPNNIFCKPAYGDQQNTTGMLVKVKIRKQKNNNKIISADASIVAMVDTSYEFNSLSDFQYLAIHKDSSSSAARCIYDDVVPKGILESSWITEEKSIPYFLVPQAFSRFDTPLQKLFKRELLPESNDDNLIGKTRVRRQKHATYLTFSLSIKIPEKPHPASFDYLNSNFVSTEDYAAVKDLLDKRPIATRMYIAYETKIQLSKLKYILPTLAYYFTTGPWRVMWVRFGYDPRKDFESRYYQQFDYRLRTQVGCKDLVDLKRTNKIHVPNTKPVRQTIIDREIVRKQEISYSPYFEIGSLPQSRQCIYQYCDIRVPKIQEMLDKIPTPSSGATCNEKSGWLPLGFDDLCRDIMSGIIKEHVLKYGFTSAEQTDNDSGDSDADDNYGDETEDLDQQINDSSDVD
ncbi:General transcription factor 3C polypeptide 5 [Pseudolycoriella hygida]|uniref:General transcription factor 3C polypeptide 5 n=1 Tax=Pseudolycoriella hygida TaxID=35572 RepID=A0A9Q0N915_9DIPT|nr:General transcription factor 3C polypeptide 5 [Pseudolycoriella hygida]